MNGKNNSAGYSIIELCIALTVSLIMMAIAVPVVQQTTSLYRLNGAVDSITAAMRATRYQALMKGYPYRLAITPSTKQYQVMNDPEKDGTFTNIGSAVPIPSSAATISAATTLEFRPNGQVVATAGAMNVGVTYNGVTKTISVSSYGNVTVTP